jgi:hypothetical protein
VAPAADFFFANKASVGFTAYYDYSRASDSNTHSVGLGPRFGLNFPLSSTLSIWPRIGFRYWRAYQSFDRAGDQSLVRGNIVGGSSSLETGVDSRSWQGLTFDAFVPLILAPVPHFFVGFGPFLETDLMRQLEGKGQTRATTLGGRFTIGGWL